MNGNKSKEENNREVRLSAYEQETIITFNEEENMASIYTCNKALQRKLDVLCIECPGLYKHVTREPRDRYGRFYEAPKRFVRIGKPTRNKGNTANLARTV